MTRALYLAVLLAVGCASNAGTTHDYAISGDGCKIYADQATCAAHAGCSWFAIGAPCQVGQPCQSGVCASTSGGGSGSGSGSGSAACACPDGGACWEQIGGPAQQSGGEPQIQCGPAYACPGDTIPCDPCASITGQGTCTLDPNVANLCLCDNGIR
jgi:hypothetical protein